MSLTSPKHIGPIQIYNNNQSALILLTSGAPNFHGRMKHYNIKSTHLHKATLNLHYCPTHDMLADLLTKSLPHVTIEHHCNLLSLVDSSAFN